MVSNTPTGPLSRGTKRKRDSNSLPDLKSRSTPLTNDPNLPGDVQRDLDNLPNFPHRPFPKDRAFTPPQRVSSPPRSFKNQQFLALSEILQRCLREGDFKRASRAFTLLLRFEHRGQSLDLRRDNNWRTAVEILLRRFDEQQDGTHEDRSGNDESTTKPIQSQSPFPRRGFMQAKEFYERLVLQYPYQRTRPNEISAVTFYPAFFMLWIQQVQSQYQTHHHESRGTDRERSSSPVSPHSSSSANMRGERGHLTEGNRGLAGRAIEDAQEIRNRLGDVLLVPPYDNDARLLELQTMVCLWIADLHEENTQDETAIVDLREEAARSRRRAVEHGCKFIG